MSDLLKAFGDHLEQIPDADSNKRHWLFGYALEWISINIDRLYHDLGGDEGVAQWIRSAYQTYAEPIDVPYIPDAVEKVLDEIIIQNLIDAAKAAHDALHPEAK